MISVTKYLRNLISFYFFYSRLVKLGGFGSFHFFSDLPLTEWQMWKNCSFLMKTTLQPSKCVLIFKPHFNSEMP